MTGRNWGWTRDASARVVRGAQFGAWQPAAERDVVWKIARSIVQDSLSNAFDTGGLGRHNGLCEKKHEFARRAVDPDKAFD